MVISMIKDKTHHILPIMSCLVVMTSATAYFLCNRLRTEPLVLENSKNTGPDGKIPFAPKKLPIIGHLLSLGPIPSKQILKWHQEIGPIFQLQMGTQLWIMVADPILAYELFVVQGKKSWSRPYHRFGVEIYGRNNRGILFTDNISKWRSHRVIARTILNPNSVDAFRGILEDEADDFIHRIVEISERDGSVNPYYDLQLCSMNFILQTCFATRLESTNEFLFQEMIQYMDRGVIYGSIAYDLGSYISGLSWLDSMIRKEKEMQDFVSRYRDKPFEHWINHALNGDADCLIKTAYTMIEHLDLDEDDILVFMSDFVGTGVESTAVSLYWAFAILSQNPYVQENIAKELDTWRRKHRAPNHLFPVFKYHEKEFPYMIAVQKEIMRFRPTSNFGLPHAVTEDIVTDNYIVPKGATLISSMAAMHMNSNYYEDPHLFKPERFIDDETTTEEATRLESNKRDHFGFGWGRRMCPGIHLVEVGMFNIYVRLFSNYTIEPQLDKNGNPINIDLDDFEDKGLIMRPLPFNVRLVPRQDT